MPGRDLFVYGTLRDPEVRALVLGGRCAATAVPAIAPGHLVVCYPGRSYPAILAAPGAVATGLLLGRLAARHLAALDRFEGAEYCRRPIAVRAGGALRLAETYWPAVAVGGEPEWRLEDWVVRHKAAFLVGETAALAARAAAGRAGAAPPKRRT